MSERGLGVSGNTATPHHIVRDYPRVAHPPLCWCRKAPGFRV